MHAISDDERRRRLVRRQLLAPSTRVDDVVSAVESVVALHSSDPTSVVLSACARMTGGTVLDVERALYDDRSIIRFHAMRRTLWAMSPDVARSANAGFTRKIARSERRRTAKLFGRDADWVDGAVERVVDVVEAADGPIGTREVGEALPDLAEPVAVGVGTSYQAMMAAHTRILLQAGFEGRIVRARPAGTWIGSQYSWAANDDWLGTDWSEPDELGGATDIVGRWLGRFGPGTFDDILWWTGSTKSLIRRALDEAGAQPVTLGDGSEAFVAAGDHRPTAPCEPSVSLLPGLDPTVMGWKRRAWYLPADVAARVTDRNGNVGPTVWFDGCVVGGWAQRPDGTIACDVGGSLTRDRRRLIDDEIERIRAIVGDTRFRVRFPAPMQRDLLA